MPKSSGSAITVGITGASGAVYAQTLCECSIGIPALHMCF